ncbi:caspase family protein [Lacinutrix sp. C3R15]|uniref:caspase family protein n=1 Tax=Flavobacteriaceae TaxID=49546 RepID=UPI001C08F5C6|nr:MULTISPECIES: caspase family protein [Flavobacteriaceae]MBU2938529.1 caspase family protein [Lacinutrix sp. C3R15]MDO6621843.1 caspase family protein [Oceanihabitans sp. 1_MG-2023]
MNLENAHALIIGVGADLPITVKDATAIASILKNPNKAAYKENNVVLLTEQNATKQKVLAALNTLVEKASQVEDATIIIYYSGHGGIFKDEINGNIKDNYYLLTNGYDAKNRQETMILGYEFSELIDKIKSKKLLVMLDCCHAAGMLGTKPLMKSISQDQEITNSNIELLKMLNTGEGRVFVTSCDDDEQSVILPESKNSLFTEVVLEALSGKASNGEEYVRVIELLYYVLTQVPKRIQKFNHVQRPIINRIDFLSPDYYLCKSAIQEEIIEKDTAVSFNLVDNMEEKIKNLIEEYNLKNSHNTIALDIESSENHLNNQETIKKIESHIINGDTKKAITLFLDFTENTYPDQRNDAILIAGRYNALFKQKMTNLISDESYRIEMAKINTSLSYFLSLCD